MDLIEYRVIRRKNESKKKTKLISENGTEVKIIRKENVTDQTTIRVSRIKNKVYNIQLNIID